VQFGYVIRTAHGMGLSWQTCNLGVHGVVTSKAGDIIGQVRFTSAQALWWVPCGKRWTPEPI
jgi:hypothetical protein